MVSTPLRLVARALWAIPLLLAGLCWNQADVAGDLRETLRKGESATATVTRYRRVDRQDVSLGEVSLRVPLADGRVLVREHLALPYSLSHRVEKDTLGVRVLPGADQEIVIASIAATQSRIAAINAGICGIAALMASIGLLFWNRSLRQRGDPGQALPG